MSLLLAMLLFTGQAPIGPDASAHTPGHPDPDTRREGPRARLHIDAPELLYGEREVEELNRETKRRAGTLRRCYERAAQRDPTLRGQVRAEVIVGAVGRVTGVRLLDLSAELEDPDLRQCLRRTYRSIRFAETEGPAAAFTQKLAFFLD